MELIDRDIPFKTLHTVWQDCADSGCCMLIHGEAGIGKTALVEQFVHYQEQPARVLWGGCEALFTPRPLGPLYDIFAQTKGELPDLLNADVNRPAIFAACLQMLQSQPTITVIEDIHWADEATLDLLKYLGRRIHRTQSLLVVTYRDDEMSPQHPLRLLLGDLATSAALRRIALPALSVEGVRRLIGERPFDAQSLHQLTNGNPFYTTEVLATEQGGIPPTVRDAILARAARLSLSGRAILDAAAVIGPRIEPWLLIEVTRTEACAVDESLSLGILLYRDKLFAFRHELARQVILDEIAPHQWTFLHQAVLDVLKTSSPHQDDVNRLSHHAEAAGDQGAILAYARAAGQRAAAAGMHRAAAKQFTLALRHSESLPFLEQIELNEAYALCVQGDPDRKETITAFRRAAALAHKAGLVEREGFALARLASVLETVGQRAESEQLLNSALAILEPLTPNRGLVVAYRMLAMKHLQQGEAKTAVGYAEKSLQMALALEEVRVITGVSQILGLCWLPLDHQRGCDQLEECLQVAFDHNLYWIIVSLYANLTMIYVDVYKLDRAQELLSTALPFATEHDMDAANYNLQAWRAMLYLYQGRWAECREACQSLLRQSRLQPISRYPALAAFGRLLARQGNAEKASALLDEALSGSAKIQNQQRMGVYYCAGAESAWLADDTQSLHQYIDAFYQTAIDNKQPGFAAELAYWRWKVGEKVETFDWMVQPFVLEIQGDWRTAADEWKRLGCPYEQARALSDGDIEAQKEALVIFERLGARPMAELVSQKLRAAGIQTIPRGPRPTTRANPFGLTNRQVEVLTLLTENLTNAQIAARLHISPKTVDHHVSAVLTKLNVSSRVEAADLARKHLDR